MKNSEIVSLEDIRKHGFCLRGVKTYCSLVGYPYKDLIKNKGVPIDILMPFYDKDEKIKKIIDERNK